MNQRRGCEAELEEMTFQVSKKDRDRLDRECHTNYLTLAEEVDRLWMNP